MATKTERILGYLPGTFQAAPVLSALRALIDAPGRELLLAENSLAALMRAHWVDHADRGAEEIHDLELFAALYGLAPRPDESVEEFREHLKRYVRTFLEGTVTVQGILRVTAEVLGLHIADGKGELDGWWSRASDELITRELRADDAAELVLGARSVRATGRDEAPARVVGTTDLSGGLALGDSSILRLKVDTAPLVEVDLAAATSLQDAVEAINTATAGPVATHDERFLTLASPKLGLASRLEVREGAGDVATTLLGLAPRGYRGTAARPAEVTGSVDLGGGIDLSDERYLRLVVDGSLLAEVNCAGAVPGATTLDEIAAAIDGALGAAVASHDGQSLTLTSPTSGTGSSIVLQSPAAQDARARLFGPLAASAFFGVAEQPARVVGRVDLAASVDLSARSTIRLRLDAAAGVVVDCSGGDPARTQPAEIVAAINAALGAEVASHDGRFVTVTSTKNGPSSRVAFLKMAPGEDVSGEIFCVAPRVYQGADAVPARLTGTVSLATGVDLRARGALQLAVDGEAPVEIDLLAAADDPGTVTLDELVTGIDQATAPGVASHDGTHLTLRSLHADGGSLTLEPLVAVRRRRFVSRARVTDEAAPALFGYLDRTAQGTAATAARVSGTTDLSRGVDLREERYLRLAIDGREAVEIDVAGLRPRATTLAELVESVNTALNPPTDEAPVASHDKRHLTLTSPTQGAASRIAFEAPRATDATDTLLGVEPGTFRGSDETSVTFTGTADLTGGAALAGGAAVLLGVDGEAAVEIVLTEDPATLSLDQLVTAINLALGGGPVAAHDGTRLVLSSRSTGVASRIELAVPAGPDTTAALFGIAAPRSYQGLPARPAAIRGHAVEPLPADLSTVRFLRLAIDGGAAVDVDCTAQAAAPDAVTLEEAATAIDQAVGEAIATVDGNRLVLTSPTTGLGSRIALERRTGGDARTRLFGAVEEVTTGTAPAPAILTGEVDLLAPVDLGERRRLRLAVDGAPAVEIDVGGVVAPMTFLDEVLAALDEVFPGLAARTGDDRIELTSPTAGETSRLELLPLRYLEVVEYPPEPAEIARTVTYVPSGGSRGGYTAAAFTVRNAGAAEAFLEVGFRAPQGVFGAALVHRGLGIKARVLTIVEAGGAVRLWRDPGSGLAAEVTTGTGETRPVPAAEILVEPLHPGDPVDRESVLSLPRGRSSWFYLDCVASRFDAAHFDVDTFLGEPCREYGVFDASHFAPAEPEAGGAIFAPPEIISPGVELVFRWQHHRPGAFEVNLPADLEARFGGRFNEQRFGVAPGEVYTGVALEPPVDESHLIRRIQEDSTLVEAAPEPVALVPLGWEPVAAPFRKPRFLTLGDATRSAALYLAAEGLDGFLEIRAREAGAWGNEIAVSVRPDGPGLYEVTIHYAGARFENARQAVRGPELAASAEKLIQPGPIGVLQAKAAGVVARVTRDRAELPSTITPTEEK